MTNMGSDRHTESQGQRSRGFSRENRVRFFYLVTDLLPPPDPHYMGGVTGGEGFFKLEELLKRRLGRFSLGNADVEENIKNFILNASEDELLTLVELMPLAQTWADEDESQRGRYAPFWRDTSSKVETIVQSVNLFLEAISSPARFSSDGSFDREGFVDQSPRKLLDLPRKDSLVIDLDHQLHDGKVMAVIFVDLDNFKTVNERFDHGAGDKCLEAVVEIIGTAVRGKGRQYRYGGDEFVILLSNFETEEARATAERIRSNIDTANPGGSVRVTASIGVASSDVVESPEKLIQAADEAVLVSKHTTKNCVTTWPPTPEARATADSRRQKSVGR